MPDPNYVQQQMNASAYEKVSNIFSDQRAPTQEEAKAKHDEQVRAVKQFRVDADNVLQSLKSIKLPQGEAARAIALARTNLEQAIMWGGMTLKALGEANPYPNSYNPENTVIDKTADGLKL
jgi:hypothetical protein